MLIAFQLAVKNVYRKRERSLLTIIGVLLAVGSFISLLSLAEGLYARFAKEISGRKVDVYVLPPDAAALPTGPVGTIGFTSDVLSLELVKKLEGKEQFPDISSVCPIYRFPQKIGNQTILVWGLGEDKFPLFFPRFNLKPGSRMYSADAPEVVVGGNFAMARGINIDTPIVIEGQPFTTVGIGKPGESFADHFCYISLENAIKLKNAKGAQEIWIQLEKSVPATRKQVADAIKTAYPHLNVKTREEYLGSANEYVSYAWLMQFAIAAIGVLIALTAAMNTMLMSTYERVKEFGTLRSIGTSRFTVFFMIQVESLMLCFIGGIGGVVLGIMGSQLLNDAVMAVLQLSFPLAKITPSLIAYAFLLSGFVGIVAAIIPAIIVYKMNIIDALRWE
ncbi:MAG: ABC transporter permease [Firmicutes bacterium]|nr:ABC transporter permease [Bacillota bacterium]